MSSQVDFARFTYLSLIFDSSALRFGAFGDFGSARFCSIVEGIDLKKQNDKEQKLVSS
jgi:hypothetical protein